MSKKTAKPDPVQAMVDKIVSAITNKEVVCTKRAVTNHFQLSAEEADSLFEKLVEQGRVGKKLIITTTGLVPDLGVK